MVFHKNVEPAFCASSKTVPPHCVTSGPRFTVGFGFTVTASVRAGLVPHELFAVTEIFPDVVPNVTFIDVVFCPEFIVDPTGTVHVYPVALVTALIE